jgi:hypothetical protein
VRKVQDYSARWLTGWLEHVNDVLEASREMMEEDYTPAKAISDWTALAFRTPSVILGLKTKKDSVEHRIRKTDESGHVSVAVSKVGKKPQSSVLKGPKTDIPAKNVRAAIDDDLLDVQFSDLGKLGLQPGEHVGEITFDDGAKIPVTITVTDD